MLYLVGQALRGDAYYEASKQGKTGLTVTVDVYNPSGTKVVADGAATEIGGGFYTYLMAANLNTVAGHYRFVFKTADATVDRQHQPALCISGETWVERVDVAVSSRLPAASYTTPPTVAEIEDGVLDALTADHVTAGTIGKAIGDAGSGSVVVNARVAVSAVEAASVASGKLGFVRYYSFAESIPSDTTEALNTATEIWLAIKHSKDDSDASSILLVSKTNGLEVLNGSAYGTPAHGSLSIAGISGDWDADVDVTHDVTPSLPLGTYYAELKALLANGRTIQAWAGKADVKEGLIKAIA
jgi:hypothetical protein